MVFTDGSCRSSSTGYGVVAYHLGKQIFQVSIPFARKASNYDTEMYALGHASSAIRRIVLERPYITHVNIFSDASSAIKKIFDRSPHPSQTASILFQAQIHKLFTRCKDIKVHVLWTPGHQGTSSMNHADELAKHGSNSKKTPFINFTRHSAALSNLEANTLTHWKQHINNHPIKESSRFFTTSQVLHPHLRPPK